MLRRGRCFALCTGSWSDLIDKHFSNCPTLLFLYKLTAGRVKLNFLKMKKSMFTAFAVGLSLTASVMAQVPNYLPTNGLVGYWPFNGNANDESGNGNNGTVNGATLTTDRNGVANKAYSFDGVNDDIFLNNQTSLGSQNIFSLSMWINVNSYGSAQQSLDISTIYMKNDPWYSTSGWSLLLNRDINNINNRGINLYVAGSSPYIFPFNFQINTWYHIALSINNNTAKLYINNTLINSISGINNLPISNTGSYVGNGNTQIPASYLFPGKIDDIGLWNSALTECEVADLYNAQINYVAGSISVAPNPASIGSYVTLLTASNSTNLQWQTNGVNLGWQNIPSNTNYSGGNTNTLVVNNVQLANHNQPFRVIGSNGNCTDTSNIATIQIADTCITNVTVYDTLLTSVTDTLIINTTLSLPAPNNENTILIYPNPASDHITIDNGNFAAMAGYSIKIENNAGQQVFLSAIDQAQFYVDLSTWSGNGLYFVHLIDPQNNTVTVRKIVLQ